MVDISVHVPMDDSPASLEAASSGESPDSKVYSQIKSFFVGW